MIKLSGIIIFSFSLCAYGIYLSSELKEKCLYRREAITLLQSIERAILYGNMPITQVISLTRLEHLSKCGFIFSICNLESRKNTYSTLGAFSEQDKRVLCDFFDTLGKTPDSEYELKRCRYCLSYFDSTQMQFEKDISVKATLYKKIGLIAGLISAIIFI